MTPDVYNDGIDIYTLCVACFNELRATKDNPQGMSLTLNIIYRRSCIGDHCALCKGRDDA